MGKMTGVVGGAVLVVALLGSCSDDDGSDTEEPAVERTGDQVERGAEDSVLVRATPQQSDGTSVVVDEVVLSTGPGYVVIYADGDGAPGRQLGVSALLDEGTSEDVVVELDDPVAETAVVHAMVHLEDNANDAFDFPAADQPAALEDGIVEVPFELEIP